MVYKRFNNSVFINNMVTVTGRVACKQMMPKDERRLIREGKKEREGRRRKGLTRANTVIYSNKGGLLPKS